MDLYSHIEELKALEHQSQKSAPLQKMPAGIKMILTLVFVVLCISISPEQWLFFAIAGVAILGLLLLAKIPWSIVKRRVLSIAPVLMLFAVSNLFQNRYDLFFSVIFKGLYCVMLVTILMGVTSRDDLRETLIAWHIPKAFVVQLALMMRYIYVFLDEGSVMLSAYQLRSGQHKGVDLRDTGPFLGSMILRSLDHGEKIYDAIMCRGGLFNEGKSVEEFNEPFQIAIEDLTLNYPNQNPILEALSLTIKPGEKVAIIGPNGAGKSSLLLSLVGLGPKAKGTINIGGMPLDKAHLKTIRQKAGMIFQNPDNQVFQSKVKDDLCFGPKKANVSPEEIETLLQAVAERFQIEHLLDRYCHTLSGGEKRMVALAGILMMKPQAIFMDEPTVYLDPRSRRQLLEHLQKLALTQLIVTHDLDLAWDLCDRVILIDEGRICADGGKEILENEALLAAHSLERPFKLQGV